jgi:hypothetical protein
MLQYLDYKTRHDLKSKTTPDPTHTSTPPVSAATTPTSHSDAWMDEIMAGGEGIEPDVDEDPLEEFHRYFDVRKRSPTREDCPDPIAWWGVRCCYYV